MKLRASTATADDGNDGISLVLSVRLPNTYPKTAPECKVTFGGGVSSKARMAISNTVRVKSKELLGSEMIFEIAESIKEILDHAAELVAQNEDLPALNEERAHFVRSRRARS